MVASDENGFGLMASVIFGYAGASPMPVGSPAQFCGEGAADTS